MSDSTATSVPVTIIRGDGIGPEVTDATLRLMREAGAKLDVEECIAGAEVFKAGNKTGVPDETADSIRRTGVVLKGPLATPIGFGEKSANVTLRKMFETYANIRPAREIPGVTTPYKGRGVDIVVVRENVEDLYAGIEHMQSPTYAQSLKVISQPGSERIARIAFEFARAEGRKSVTCATKANIMKLSEGTFKRGFEVVAPEYPDIEAKQILIDNCAAQLVMKPEQFDVIVTTNMNGDILSDLTSGLVGGLGFSPSANIGTDTAMFEAVHGSAPDIAGQDKANPAALMLSSVMLLRHIGQADVAQAIEDAVITTLEDARYLTGDIARDHDPVGTIRFTDAVIENLGRQPKLFPRRESRALVMPRDIPSKVEAPKERSVVGVDIFVEHNGTDPAALGELVKGATTDAGVGSADGLSLSMIENRGTKVYPGPCDGTDFADVWRCRFLQSTEDQTDHKKSVGDKTILELLTALGGVKDVSWMHVEKLQIFDNELGYTRAQGED